MNGMEQNRRLYLLTPLPLEHVKAACHALARGALQLPLVAMYRPTGACVCV